MNIVDSEKANTAVAIMQNVAVIGISPQLAILAAQLGKHRSLPGFDSISKFAVYAAGRSLIVQDL